MMTVKDCIHQFMHFVASLSTFSKICWLISLTAFVITVACVIYVGCAANANSSLISKIVIGTLILAIIAEFIGSYQLSIYIPLLMALGYCFVLFFIGLGFI